MLFPRYSLITARPRLPAWSLDLRHVLWRRAEQETEHIYTPFHLFATLNDTHVDSVLVTAIIHPKTFLDGQVYPEEDGLTASLSRKTPIYTIHKKIHIYQGR